MLLDTPLPGAAPVTTRFDAVMRAYSHPMRRRILEWLKDPQANFPDQEYGHHMGVCMGQIVKRCRLSPSSVSNHLSLLRWVGLVQLHKSGQVHFFTRNEPVIESFKATLVQQLQR
ncbi:ArsR/SmtB family transcription factor [Pseudomonas sp. TE3610]